MDARWAFACLAAATLLFASPDHASAQSEQERQAAEQEASGDDQAEAIRRALNLDNGENDGPATLEADEIDFDSANEIVRARGDVNVFFGDRVLRADELTYEARTDTITARGDVRLVNPDGSTLTASEATLDSQLKDGLITGARAVLQDGKGRLAAVEARRIDGKFTQLSKAVFSSCEVCADNPTPLWRIRARRVIQDQEARDIVYEDATFEVLGVPVAFLPFFRHPDPSVKRRTGVLTPEYLETDALGSSVRVPVYIELAPNRDITLTPLIATEENPVLEGEYRSLIDSGQYTLGGSATWSRDSEDDGFRGHFIGEGEFDVGGDFLAGYEALIASDDTYLRRYRFSNQDRAEVRLYTERYRSDGFVSVEAYRYQSFREDEPAGQIPLVAPLAEVEQSFDAPIGGQFVLNGNSLYLRRTNGADVGRLVGSVAWNNTYITGGGVVFDTTASIRGDLYRTFDDPDIDGDFQGRALPLASATASYPLGMSTEAADHVIEPIGVVTIAPYGGNPSDIGNEDSQDAELDELNVFSVSRFPGLDRWEEGPRATMGLRYQRFARSGPDFEALLGQSYRLRDTEDFSDQSGLDGVVSDVVGGWRIAQNDTFELAHRFRISDSFSFARNEVYARGEFYDRFRASSSYVFLEGDPALGEEEDRAELNVTGELDVTSNWTILGNARRDIDDNRFVTAGGGLRYANECVQLDFGVRRRFNEVDDVPESTDFSFKVRLLGVGE